jgi:flagellar hook-length control protein FliK
MIPATNTEGAAAAAPWFPPSAAQPPAQDDGAIVTFADLLNGTVGPDSAVAAPSGAADEDAPTAAFSLETLWLQLLARQTQPSTAAAAEDAEAADGESPQIDGSQPCADVTDASETDDDDGATVDLSAVIVPVPQLQLGQEPVAEASGGEDSPDRGAGLSAVPGKPEGLAPRLMSGVATPSSAVPPPNAQELKAPKAATAATADAVTTAAVDDAVVAGAAAETTPQATAVVARPAADVTVPLRESNPSGVPGEPERFAPRVPNTADPAASAVKSSQVVAELAASAAVTTPSAVRATNGAGSPSEPERSAARPSGQAAFAAAAPGPAAAGGVDLQQQNGAGDRGSSGQPFEQPAASAPAPLNAATQAMPQPVFPVASLDVLVHQADAALGTTPSVPRDAEIENLSRLVESMKVQYRQGIPEATIRLKPEHFGEVTISIRVERGAVSAVMHADTPEAQQWLAGHEDRLRSGLADQGLHLDRYVVQRDRSQDQPRQQHQQQRQAFSRFRRGQEPAERFEVTA